MPYLREKQIRHFVCSPKFSISCEKILFDNESKGAGEPLCTTNCCKGGIVTKKKIRMVVFL